MRVFSMPSAPEAHFMPPDQAAFQPLCAAAFDQARSRHVPVFLVIGTVPPEFSDASLSMQIAERTVPVQLLPGMRPDVELLCQRAGALFSGEGALPLAALLLDDARPFLAAPLPPAGFPLEPSRLYVWLSQADRRFAQNLPALTQQAAEVIRSLRIAPLSRPYSPKDASHDLLRALIAAEDKVSGGLNGKKAPFVCALRFLQHEGDEKSAHSALSRALEAMLCSPVYDPLDGGFFRAALTDDWRVPIPEKPLGMNAMLALILLDSGRRSEAIHVLDFMLSSCSLSAGALTPFVSASPESLTFTPEQVCASLGNEDGLRAVRLLNLRRQHAKPLPSVIPSRFSPVMDTPEELPPLVPTLSPKMTPEDTAFLHRVTPALLRLRAARMPLRAASTVICEDCALAAAVFASCGRRLGEARYVQAAQRAVSYLIALPSNGLTPSYAPTSLLNAQPTCGASAALALALLTLGQDERMTEYRASGLRILHTALHAFVREDGLPMHTPQDAAAFFPRIPAIFDGELPSPAALLVHALLLADAQCPGEHYLEGVEAIWAAAAPAAKAHPLACAALIDAARVLTKSS